MIYIVLLSQVQDSSKSFTFPLSNLKAYSSPSPSPLPSPFQALSPPSKRLLKELASPAPPPPSKSSAVHPPIPSTVLISAARYSPIFSAVSFTLLNGKMPSFQSNFFHSCFGGKSTRSKPMRAAQLYTAFPHNRPGIRRRNAMGEESCRTDGG